MSSAPPNLVREHEGIIAVLTTMRDCNSSAAEREKSSCDIAEATFKSTFRNQHQTTKKSKKIPVCVSQALPSLKYKHTILIQYNCTLCNHTLVQSFKHFTTLVPALLLPASSVS